VTILILRTIIGGFVTLSIIRSHITTSITVLAL
jgi:hypothetical protein